MKKFLLLSFLYAALTGCAFLSCNVKKPAPEKLVAKTLATQTLSFSSLNNRLLNAVESGSLNEYQLQQLFLQTRLAYKKFEWAAEYFAPTASRFVNGPPVQEIEATGGLVLEPAGLQVIEGLLFPVFDSARKKELIRQLKLLPVRCDKYTSYFKNIDIFDWQVFDAAKLEIFRIATLGISGFDNPLSQKSMSESAASLASLKQVMAYYTGNDDAGILNKFDLATDYLTKDTAFNSFNRAIFITQYINPLTTCITDLAKKLKLHFTTYNRLLNQDAKTLFDTTAFNVNAYVPDQTRFLTVQKVALGKLLFSDPGLSGTKTRSCQSCHQPEKAFTDGLIKNTALNTGQPLRRNTPTLINAALQPAQFYDLRVNTLEDQSLSVVQNKDEMHGSLKVAVDRLWQQKKYRKMFSDAFPKTNRSGIDTLEVMNAIGSYVRSLVFLNSRFDDYMRGQSDALSKEEITGFNLFMGKAKCATCHYMPLFNGTFPPRYMKMETEVIGVPQSMTSKRIDSDMGRFNILRVPSLQHSFKTVSIRNAARTAPYMHNGTFTTLEQVVDFYNKGGGRGLGIKIDNQTLPFDKLQLTHMESKAIVAFIKSLDSR